MIMHDGHEHHCCDGHDHEHDHEHGLHHHHHDHEHDHGDTAETVPEQTIALVSYMVDHNRAHANDIHELAHKLEAMGQYEVAELMGEGLSCYIDGNERLAEALEVLKGGK